MRAEEEAAVLGVLASGQLAQGEQVAIFERRFAELCQVREAAAASSGRVALHLHHYVYDKKKMRNEEQAGSVLQPCAKVLTR